MTMLPCTLVRFLTKRHVVMAKTKELGTKLILSLLIIFLLPAVIVRLVNAIYNFIYNIYRKICFV